MSINNWYKLDDIMDGKVLVSISDLRTVQTRKWHLGSAIGLRSALKECKIFPYITEISDYRFSGFYLLERITLPNMLERIGEGTFSHCISLEEIDIPNTVKSIGIMAFWDCARLKSIKLPDSIESIGDAIFDECESLKEITYRGRSIKVSCIDGWCMELTHSKKYDKYTIHKGYHFPDYETVYYVAECDGKYAHGETAKEAIRDLEFKLCKDRGIEQYRGLTLNDKVNGYEFYRIMTGACHAGVKDYCDRTGTDINGEYTIQEVINKTQCEYGHNTLLSNLQKLKII